MAKRSKTALTWTLRLTGVGLLVWVLATQVQWQDRVALKTGDAWIGEVESVKAVSELFMPVGGEVLIAVSMSSADSTSNASIMKSARPGRRNR